MTTHVQCRGAGCPGCCMTGLVDRWGLSRPRPLWHTVLGSLRFMSSRPSVGMGWETHDVRDAWTRWEHMWHDVGVMWYYDSAWSREGDATGAREASGDPDGGPAPEYLAGRHEARLGAWVAHHDPDYRPPTGSEGYQGRSSLLCGRCGLPLDARGLCPNTTPPVDEPDVDPRCAPFIRPFSSRACVLGTPSCESDHGTCRVCGRMDQQHVCGGCGEWDCRCTCFTLEDP